MYMDTKCSIKIKPFCKTTRYTILDHMQLCITVVSFIHIFIQQILGASYVPCIIFVAEDTVVNRINQKFIFLQGKTDRVCMCVCMHTLLCVCVVIWGKIKQGRGVGNWDKVEFLSRMVKNGLPVVTWDEGLKKVKGCSPIEATSRCSPVL